MDRMMQLCDYAEYKTSEGRGNVTADPEAELA